MNWTPSYRWSDSSKLRREMPIKQFKQNNPHPRAVLVKVWASTGDFCVFYQLCVPLAMVCQFSFHKVQHDNIITTVCVVFTRENSPLLVTSIVCFTCSLLHLSGLMVFTCFCPRLFFRYSEFGLLQLALLLFAGLFIGSHDIQLSLFE